MPENESKIELRTEEVREILGHVPHWIVRWGISLFLLAISLLLIGSWVFKYPDIISAHISITTENPPSHAIARADGRIMNLFVKDNEVVKNGQILAIIENPSRYSDVSKLKLFLDSLQMNFSSGIETSALRLPGGSVLGDIQPAYSHFLKQYEDLQNFILLDYHEQKIKSIRNEILNYQNYSRGLQTQNIILSQEEYLTRIQLHRDSALLEQGVIPVAEYERSKAVNLQKRFNLEQSLILQTSNEIQISQLEQRILDLQLQANQERSKLRLLVNEALENLLAEISQWEQKYVLRTAVDGIVTFTRIWSENQHVRTGDMVMSVVPVEQGEVIGKLTLPLTGSGKVRPGQRVNVKFDGYPYMEFGMVRGSVQSISLVTTDNTYMVQVMLNEGLKTNYGISLDFSQEMQGIAEIITDDKRMLERIVYPVRYVIQKQKGL